MGNIQGLLKENKRDEKILDTITDLTPYSTYMKQQKEENNHYCWVCKQAESPRKEKSGDSIIQWVECDKCVRWYHPECLDTTIEDVENDRYTYEIWHCKFCCMQDVFVARNI